MDLKALREKKARFIIGVMSGTSCDAVDAALVRIKGTGPELRLKFMHFATFPYPESLKNRLMDPHLTLQEVCLLNFELGELFAQAIDAVKGAAKDLKCEVDFVASHGHTVAHYPPRGDNPRFGTLQIGEPSVIAEATGLPVISDFRPRDMAAGGQGAPLVPYADWVLFSRMQRPIACLNIGGIANFTVVTPEFDGVFAFDTGPGNMTIDGTIRYLTRGMQPFDKNGETAARGKVIDEFFDFLLSHQYFKRKPPKSTGREEFGFDSYLRDGLASRRERSLEDLVATATAAVGTSIANAFNQFIATRTEVSEVIVSGGGALNSTLLDWIRKGLSGTMVRASDQYGLPSKAREAISFAILGNETVCGTPSNVPQATGARHPAILGKITPV